MRTLNKVKTTAINTAAIAGIFAGGGFIGCAVTGAPATLPTMASAVALLAYGTGAAAGVAAADKPDAVRVTR